MYNNNRMRRQVILTTKNLNPRVGFAHMTTSLSVCDLYLGAIKLKTEIHEMKMNKIIV